MSNISFIKGEIDTIKAERKKLSHKDMKLVGKLSKLTKEWQDACSHPKEYIQIINMHYEDDYGKLCSTPENEYEYRCNACNKYFQNKEEL